MEPYLFLIFGLLAISIFIGLFWLKRLSTQLKNSELEKQEQLLELAKAQLSQSFSSLAREALEGNNRQFLDLAKTTLEKEQATTKSELEKKEQSIASMVNPLKEVLDKYHSHINDIEKERQKSYTSVEAELKRIVEISGSLSQETAALKNALKKPHVRGRWGEVQLKNCIDLAGMSEFADVTFQDAKVTEDGVLIPDMTVKMPGGRIVVVDAKTPIDAFLASLEATTEEEKQAEMLRHGKHIKEHVRKLSIRAYAEQLKESADFTVMFLPNESFLYAALETEPDLVEFALKRKVLITTPPTLIGLLKVIRYGWNEERLAENAEKISEAGKELHKRVCDFMDAYMSVGKHLEKAKDEYNSGLNRLEHRVLVQAKKLEKLGAKGKKTLPEELNISDEIETTTLLDAP